MTTTPRFNRQKVISTLLGVCLLGVLPMAAAEREDANSLNGKFAQRGELPLLAAEELEVNLDRRKPFDASLLPERLRKLEGEQVQIRGYMFPTFDEKNKHVLLTTETKGKSYPDYLLDVPLQCLVHVEMRPDATEFTVRPIIARGVLRFSESRVDGELVLIYKLEDARIEIVTPRAGYRNSIHRGC